MKVEIHPMIFVGEPSCEFTRSTKECPMNIPVLSQSMSSDSIAALAKAMIKAQASIVPASKDRLNPFTRSMYATLGSVVDSCRQALLNAGIWVTQYPVPVDGGESGSVIGLVTKLVHADSGEWQSSLLVMPVPKNDPQGFGSALTYARRYGLSAMVGIVTEDDDDANGACLQPRSNAVVADPVQTPPPPAKPAETARNHIATPVPPASANLPRIDGVTFSQGQGQDGNTYVTAAGDTRNKTAILKEAGFRWDAVRKLWWRYQQQPVSA
jgi:hypothetical protein